MTPVLPPRIPAYEAGTFAHYTVTTRLPAILRDVRAQFGSGSEDERWALLETSIVRGGTIDARLLSPKTSYFRAKVESIAGQTWAEQSFFDLEFLFYLALNSIGRDLRPGVDVFAASRRAALVEALPQLEAGLSSTASPGLEVALRLAMNGNEVDLSQLARETSREPESLLVDEMDDLLALLRSSDGKLVVLADNAGTELGFDLALIDALLSTRAGPVELELKPQPMFVSDALITDVHQSVEAFERCPATSVLSALGKRLRSALRDGRLLLEAPADWAEPRHMNQLSDELTGSLRSATLVLAKGDLNYRRFFEDRAWPAETPVATASVATAMRAFALRVVKSDSLVGLSPARAARRARAGYDFRSGARDSMIQRVDRGAAAT